MSELGSASVILNVIGLLCGFAVSIVLVVLTGSKAEDAEPNPNMQAQARSLGVILTALAVVGGLHMAHSVLFAHREAKKTQDHGGASGAVHHSLLRSMLDKVGGANTTVQMLMLIAGICFFAAAAAVFVVALNAGPQEDGESVDAAQTRQNTAQGAAIAACVVYVLGMILAFVSLGVKNHMFEHINKYVRHFAHRQHEIPAATSTMTSQMQPVGQRYGAPTGAAQPAAAGYAARPGMAPVGPYQ
jgi:cytochrome bd-type quinol oxidase subunit 2